METNKTPGLNTLNANPMNNCPANPAAAPEKKENKKTDNTGNIAKVAAGAAAGAGIAFGAQAAAAAVTPEDLDAGIVLDQAAVAAEGLHTPAHQPVAATPATPGDDDNIEEPEEGELEEEVFNVEDIKLELDDNGDIVSIGLQEDVPEIIEIDPTEILYADNDDPISIDEGYPDPCAYIDDPEVPEILDDDLAFDDTNDAIDIL